MSRSQTQHVKRKFKHSFNDFHNFDLFQTFVMFINVLEN